MTTRSNAGESRPSSRPLGSDIEREGPSIELVSCTRRVPRIDSSKKHSRQSVVQMLEPPTGRLERLCQQDMDLPHKGRPTLSRSCI